MCFCKRLYKKGQYFSIYRFKTLNFKAQYEADLEQFNNASILLYNTTGDLLLEKSFPIEIKKTVSSQT
jgi:hypothetical protein